MVFYIVALFVQSCKIYKTLTRILLSFLGHCNRDQIDVILIKMYIHKRQKDPSNRFPIAAHCDSFATPKRFLSTEIRLPTMYLADISSFLLMSNLGASEYPIGLTAREMMPFLRLQIIYILLCGASSRCATASESYAVPLSHL